MNSVSIITVDFPSDELAEKMGEAQYHTKDFQMISEMIFSEKVYGDIFQVVAKNENGKVVGRLQCIRNHEDFCSWYYGDLFVIPEYRRNHIAERMVQTAIETLTDRGCFSLRCYVIPTNGASISLQRKLGFSELPWEPFNDFDSTDQLMFEKALTPYRITNAASDRDARGIAAIYWETRMVFHGEEMKYRMWKEKLAGEPENIQHFLIYRGVVPVAWFTLCFQNNLNSVQIKNLAVLPPFQKKGIGRYAWENIKRMLYKHWKATADIYSDNDTAKKFFERFGFHAVSEKQILAEDGTKQKLIHYESIF